MTADLIGIVPSAGHARRLQPILGSKELVTLNGRPVMAHLLGRMTRILPAERVFVVTRADKTDLSAYAAAFGHAVVIGEPPTVAASLLLGLAAAEERLGADPRRVVLFGFPDTLFRPVDAFDRLVSHLTGSTSAAVVLGLFHFADAARADVVELVDDEVRAVRPKPADPGSDLVWGIGAARASALSGLAGVAEPGALFDSLAREGKVHGLDLGRDYIDIGVPEVLQDVTENPPDW